ncbi:conserved hypothetical protein [Candidatus Zixiibacteriota bacterium]|nr:conserved hypothetical protein [candidate division Zixibacteria bacterium]
MDKPFQRKGALSNADVGREFETLAQHFFAKQGLHLTRRVSVQIRINGFKPHNFDLGNKTEKILVECKAHKWTESDNVPSAKLTVWNEVMLFFLAAPSIYRKILFVLRDFSGRKKETLGEYYIRTNSHLIPKDVEVWEYEEKQGTAVRIR